ncbi:MAG: hypothetical protein AAF696_03960 [Bacteroidota bacterium]
MLAKKRYSILFYVLLLSSSVWAQTPVTSIYTSTRSASPSTYTSGSTTYNWGQSTDLYLDSLDISGTSYTRGKEVYGKTIKLIRVDNDSSSGERCQIFVERSSDTQLDATYPTDKSGNCSMITALSEPIINRGVLDLFQNVYEGVEYANNIERVDILTDKIVSPSSVLLDEIGFFIAEKRGNNDLQVAAILSIDANGNPASYGSLIFLEDYLTFGLLGTSYNFRFFKDSARSPHGLAEPFYNSTEQIGYSLITFQDLGLTEGQSIYGISFFGKDVDAASHTLTDPNTFPGNTNEGADIHGGFGTIFHTANIDLDDLVDTDLDGVADVDDLDDDNDGILDLMESSCFGSPRLIGSTSAEATGSGSSGIPSFFYTIPDASKRIMYVAITVERDHTPTAYGDNWESNIAFTDNLADMPNVTFGGISLFKLAYGYSFVDHDESNSPGAVTHSLTTYIYILTNSNMPTGSRIFDFSAFNIPNNAGDEMRVEAYVFAGVNSLQHIDGGFFINSGSNSWQISGTAESGSQPSGTTSSDNLLLAYGVASSSNSIESGSTAWVELGHATVTNSNGSFAGDPEMIASSENDGISTYFQAITGVSGNQTATFEITGGGNELHKIVFLHRFVGCSATDTDGDGIANHHDIDSDDDGCNDVLEAGYVDIDGDGTLGTAPLSVDADGKVSGTGDGYTGTRAMVTDENIRANACGIPASINPTMRVRINKP